MIAMRYGQTGTRAESQGESITVLWTNASPSSSFASQTITLSNSMTGYKRILIRYKYSTSSEVRSIYVDVSDFSFSGSYSDEVGLISRAGSAGYVRRMTMQSGTSVSFSTSYRINASGNSTQYSIPIELCGVN